MTDHPLGTSYLVAKTPPTPNYDEGDEQTFFRGYRDILVYKDRAQEPGEQPRVIITRGSADTDDFRAFLYFMGNLLADPGDPRFATDWSSGSALTIDFSGRPVGLYRVRVETEFQYTYYWLRIQDMQYYALECWEPRYMLWLVGEAEQAPVEQYFFVPNLSGRSLRARLETDSAGNRAQLDIYTADGSTSLLTLVARDGFSTPAVGDRFFDSGEFAPAAAAGAGQIYRLRLTVPGDPSKSPSGDVRVRLSRNVPPYFANDKNRLIVPIVHREFDPVLYTNKTSTYRAYLCANRGEAIASGVNLRLKIGGAMAETAQGYSVPKDYSSASQTRQPDGQGGELYARMLDQGVIKAESTDKTDTVYLVDEPDYTGWPAPPFYIIYDDQHGEEAETLAEGSFDSVQASSPDRFDAIEQFGMKVMGSIGPGYSGSLRSQYSQYAADPLIRFWDLFDEPDRGPGGKDSPVTGLKGIYEEYYNIKVGLGPYNGYPTTKPIFINVSHASVLEEYAEGCDFISADPWVRPGANFTTFTEILTEYLEELHRITSGLNDSKKVCVALWAWAPDEQSTVNTPGLYGCAFLAARAGAPDAISTFKWAKITNLMSFGAGSQVWETIKKLNAGAGPSQLEFVYANLRASWSLLSAPLVTASGDSAIADYFADVISAFKWAGSYQAVTEFTTCTGYWVNLTHGGCYAIYGADNPQCVLTLPAGWSMIGCPNREVTVASIGQNPPGIIISVFKMNGSYVQVYPPPGSGLLEPGRGYWINLSQPGTLTIG